MRPEEKYTVLIVEGLARICQFLVAREIEKIMKKLGNNYEIMVCIVFLVDIPGMRPKGEILGDLEFKAEPGQVKNFEK